MLEWNVDRYFSHLIEVFVSTPNLRQQESVSHPDSKTYRQLKGSGKVFSTITRNSSPPNSIRMSISISPTPLHIPLRTTTCSKHLPELTEARLPRNMERPRFNNRILPLLSQIGFLRNSVQTNLLRPAVPEMVIIFAGGHGLHKTDTTWLWGMAKSIVCVIHDVQVYTHTRVDVIQSLERIGGAFDFVNGLYEKRE